MRVKIASFFFDKQSTFLVCGRHHHVHDASRQTQLLLLFSFLSFLSPHTLPFLFSNCFSNLLVLDPFFQACSTTWPCLLDVNIKTIATASALVSTLLSLLAHAIHISLCMFLSFPFFFVSSIACMGSKSLFYVTSKQKKRKRKRKRKREKRKKRRKQKGKEIRRNETQVMNYYLIQWQYKR